MPIYTWTLYTESPTVPLMIGEENSLAGALFAASEPAGALACNVEGLRVTVEAITGQMDVDAFELVLRATVLAAECGVACDVDA